MKKHILYILVLASIYSCNRNDQLAKLPPDSKESGVTNNKPQLNVKPPALSSATNPTNSQPTVALIQPAAASTNGSEVNINTLTATVNGVETSQLSFRISGYISAVFVKNGQYIKKGQVIARLDNSIALEQLNLSKLALEQAKLNEHYAELTLKRTQTLNQRQATTQIALEQAESGFRNSQIAVKQADANLKLAQINYDETNLIAPFEGYLFNLSAWIGNYVSSTTTIATLTSVNDLQIQIPVPQTVTNSFAIGQEFTFSNSSQNVAGNLKITGIVPYVDASSKTYLLFATPVKVHGQLMAGELVVVDLK